MDGRHLFGVSFPRGTSIQVSQQLPTQVVYPRDSIFIERATHLPGMETLSSWTLHISIQESQHGSHANEEAPTPHPREAQCISWDQRKIKSVHLKPQLRVHFLQSPGPPLTNLKPPPLDAEIWKNGLSMWSLSGACVS